MLEQKYRIWRVSERRDSLGLHCGEDCLFLGATPLLERSADTFAPRPQDDLEALLSCGFGFSVSLDRVMGGLAAVSAALNAGDLCRARIAAVHLRIPDLPDVFACLDMQLEDVALKLDRIAKTTAAGDWNPAGGSGWDPDKHPRAGTAPNPGWFATTSGDDGIARPTLASDNTNDDGRFHLPPGERIDELGDLLEWIANAKPADTQAIRGEIKRLYFDVGDRQGAAALNRALSDVLEDQDPRTRQSVLDNFEIYTRTDPADVGQFARDLLTGALLGSLSTGAGLAARSAATEAIESAPAAEAATQEGAAATQEEAATAQEETAATQGRPSPFWDLGWGARGRALHDAMGGSLPWWFKGIDDFRNGIATSFKSIDLNAPTYQNAQNLASAVNRYVNSLAAFNGKSYVGWEVKGEEITGRALNLIVPKGSMTATQRSVVDSAIESAKSRGINLYVTPF